MMKVFNFEIILNFEIIDAKNKNKKGMVRFATETYEHPDENNLNHRYMHLTNFNLKTNLPYFVNQAIKEERLNILSNLKQMLTFNEYNLNNLYAISQILPKIERKESIWLQQSVDEIKLTEEDIFTLSEVLIHNLGNGNCSFI